MEVMLTVAQVPSTVVGQLHLHSETGTEGGYWAIQDERFIMPNTTCFSCTKCGVVWNSAAETEAEMSAKISTEGIFAGHRFCSPSEHTFELSPPELWSYDGLCVLETGDALTIYDNEQSDKVVWEGIVSLIEYPLFTEEVDGWWIHSDQVGVEQPDVGCVVLWRTSSDVETVIIAGTSFGGCFLLSPFRCYTVGISRYGIV
jgi:hypothetical protein